VVAAGKREDISIPRYAFNSQYRQPHFGASPFRICDTAADGNQFADKIVKGHKASTDWNWR
jgi:hypothetical protein